MAIRNVVLAGISGNLGPAILSALSASNKFTLTVFTRPGSSSSSSTTLPPNITAKEVDYTSIENLTTALRTLQTDAVVSTLGHTAAAAQTNLIHAAAAAGVDRFLPSEFGSDLDNEINRAAPVYKGKVAAQELLRDLAEQGKISYTIVYNGAFLDWGLKVGFPISVRDRRAALHDGGDRDYSTSTLGAVGRAVVGVLSLPEETRNRVVRVAEARTTLREVLDVAREVVDGEGWTVTEPDVDAEVDKAAALMKTGVVNQETIMPFIYRAVWGEGAGGLFEETDNELLGIETLDREGLKRVVEEVANSS